MQHHSVKQKLQRGEFTLGTFVFEFNTRGISRLVAEAGAEFVIFDMEHTGWNVETIASLISTTPRDRVAPFVRIPATEYHFIARVLDMGALGIMVPMVETVEQAETLVASAKYPPKGRRGAAFTIAHDDYSGGDVGAKMQQANDGITLITQIETAKGLEQVEAIAAVEGVDVLWIGQFDLSTSLGIPGQFDHPTFTEAKAQVVAAAKQHNKVAGFMPLGIEDAKGRVDDGFRCLAYHGDLWLYLQALRTDLAKVREFLE